MAGSLQSELQEELPEILREIIEKGCINDDAKHFEEIRNDSELEETLQTITFATFGMEAFYRERASTSNQIRTRSESWGQIQRRMKRGFIDRNQNIFFAYIVKEAQALNIQMSYNMDRSAFEQFIKDLIQCDGKWVPVNLASLISSRNEHVASDAESRFNDKISVKSVEKISDKDRLDSFIAAYGTISLSATLVFTFGVTLASTFMNEDSFHSDLVMNLFHILITISIGCSLYSLSITTNITYRMNRLLGLGLVDETQKYMGQTFKYRRYSRLTFAVSLVAFVLSLTVLYYDAFPIGLASFNSVVMVITIVVASISVYKTM
eukprot:143326_1